MHQDKARNDTSTHSIILDTTYLSESCFRLKLSKRVAEQLRLRARGRD